MCYEESMRLKRNLAALLIAGLVFVLGVVVGGAWGWWDARDQPVPTRRLAEMTINIEDEKCDSDFNLDWLSNTHLVGPDGNRLARLSLPQDAEATCDDGDIFLAVLVPPTPSWVYRLQVTSPTRTMSIDTFTVKNELVGSGYGPAYSFMGLSADCQDGVILCP